MVEQERKETGKPHSWVFFDKEVKIPNSPCLVQAGIVIHSTFPQPTLEFPLIAKFGRAPDSRFTVALIRPDIGVQLQQAGVYFRPEEMENQEVILRDGVYQEIDRLPLGQWTVTPNDSIVLVKWKRKGAMQILTNSSFTLPDGKTVTATSDLVFPLNPKAYTELALRFGPHSKTKTSVRQLERYDFQHQILPGLKR